MEKLRRHQLEYATRKAPVQIVALKVDTIGEIADHCVGRCPIQCGLRDVHRRHVPAVLGEPHRVGSLTATEIERAARRHRLDHLGQPDVHPSTPHPIAFAVVLFPGLLCLRHSHAVTLPPARGYGKFYCHV
jgi:hypothetical protein